ncbi:hypothetical protein DPMN_160962 [Dreissena polymorpha]|uniref:Uncharacterized protein n=1 Tax=Dreissena polymorpha TaxID=45954 RepID=A0A9D4IQM9_DREPO|nr:hypothetical protein DPMN_160962 [Dreissena polymorpha]
MFCWDTDVKNNRRSGYEMEQTREYKSSLRWRLPNSLLRCIPKPMCLGDGFYVTSVVRSQATARHLVMVLSEASL